jgi:hypothetical protein
VREDWHAQSLDFSKAASISASSTFLQSWRCRLWKPNRDKATMFLLLGMLRGNFDKLFLKTKP